jgi:(p)ppGpp synthase/HD superfamily hydrolase
MRIQPQREFTLVDMARAFDVAAHTAVNQKRKYTGEDYHVHPEEVLSILLTYCDPSAEEQAAALLHDVIEDTATTREHIARVFGQVVAKLVVEVSDVSKPSDGTRKVRKALDREHLSKASFQGKRLKCADLISNSKSIAQHDVNFAKVYLEEKLAIMWDFYDELYDEPIFIKAMEVAGIAFMTIYPDAAIRDTTMKKLLKGKPDLFVSQLWGEV